MKPSLEELQRTMLDRTDEELYCLLYRDEQNSLDAIIAAREEFSRRQLNEKTMSRIVAAAEKAPEGTGAGWGWSDYGSDSIRTATGWGCLIFLCLVGYGIYGGYEWLDGNGWIPHDHDTPVWIHGDWIVGEYRHCGMRTTTPFAGIVQLQEARADLPRLFCGKNWADEGVSEFETAMPDPDAAVNAVLGKGDWGALDKSFHILPVLYHGRIGRPDAVFVSWRCQRLSESLECKALD